VDGSASNDASNMILEARQALYIQRLRYGAEKITPELVLGWASKGSATLLGRSDIGELAVGKQADLALFKLDELRFSGSHDPISALLLCGADKADRMMIGGQWRVIDGQIEGLDVAQLIADHRQAAKALIAG
jgi:8-oxoguanine deaminase